ncbi:MAG: helix-turn-helix transcriptional regulator [Oligoflexia bacterium]|nr:helix-turn-helix transcriptional regulator [Oligoflexia bacterium]
MNNKKLEIGKVLERLLKKEKISLTELAKELGIPKSTFFGYLQNVMPKKIEHIRKICERFEISSDYLLFGCELCGGKCKTHIGRDATIQGIFKILEINKIIE